MIFIINLKAYFLRKLTYKNSVRLGFSVSYKKLIDERLSIFHAGKLKIISQMNRKDIKRLL